MMKKSSMLLSGMSLSILLMAIGIPIPGLGEKLALSNIAQIFFVLLALASRKIKYKHIVYMILLFISMTLGVISVAIQYNFYGKPLVIAFFMSSMLYVFLGIEVIKQHVNRPNFEKYIKVLIFFLTLIMLAFGAQDFITEEPQVSYGMDDKSHAAIILGFLGFLSAKYVRTFWLALLFCILYLIMSAATLSRLVGIFAPLMLLALSMRLYEENKLKAIFLATFIFVPVTLLAFIFVIDNSDTFRVVERLSSVDSISSSDSTSAHNLLLEKAIELKQENPFNFIFGVSPGAFSDVLIRSGIDFSKLNELDPQYIELAKLGKAPVHSTHLAIYCEQSIVIFLMYIFYLYYVTIRLYKLRLYIDLLFWCAFLVAITYYSAHNKTYFYCIILYIESAIWFGFAVKSTRHADQKNNLRSKFNFAFT